MARENGHLKSLYPRLLSPRVAALIVTLREDGLPNVMVAAWHTPVSVKPPIVAISIAPRRMTHGLIQKSGEFTVNIPDALLIKKVKIAGSRSGESYDKAKLFSYVPGRRVRTPVIKNALGCIECTLNRILKMGDHSLVFGNVVAVSAKGFKEVWTSSSPLLHLGSNYYTIMGRRLELKKRLTKIK
jgi:flavin reductase (DIM6/NTAB) family NADH-FMN oxidoreductase RutF